MRAALVSLLGFRFVGNGRCISFEDGCVTKCNFVTRKGKQAWLSTRYPKAAQDCRTPRRWRVSRGSQRNLLAMASGPKSYAVAASNPARMISTGASRLNQISKASTP